MKKIGLFIFSLNLAGAVFGQVARVPETIYFADMELRLNAQVREEIQLDVNALTRSERYFNIKLARVKQYFPIIERILKDEKVPDDFKYLVLQESALIPDAISTSNAVGFWQFKIPAGREVGLRIDSHVDERMNIVSSTHGAARYLRKNNFYFDNWIYALLAYNTGYGGAQAEVEERYFGKRIMNLNKRTHWYVKKFLAHKVAFETALNNGKHNSLDPPNLYEYRDGNGKSLPELAREFNVDEKVIEDYNKWLKRGLVPMDRPYTVIIPGVEIPSEMLARRDKNEGRVRKANNEEINKIEDFSPDRQLYPVIKEMNGIERMVKVNGIPGVIARPKETIVDLAGIGEVPTDKFIKYNDITREHEVVPGQVYYFKRKRNKAKEYYHTVFPDESSWSISQKYGIKEKKLLRKNRYRNDEVQLKPGMVLWIRHIRPEYYSLEFVKLPVDALRKDKHHTFTERQEKTEEIFQEEYTRKKIIREDNAREKPVEPVMSSRNIQRPAPDYHYSKNPTPSFHIVEPGETLYAISRRYEVPVSELLKINQLPADSKIQIGDKIYLTEQSSGEYKKSENLNENGDSYMIYTVKNGDTMYSISRDFNVKIEEIMKWNLKNDYSLNEGEKLKIKQNN